MKLPQTIRTLIYSRMFTPLAQRLAKLGCFYLNNNGNSLGQYLVSMKGYSICKRVSLVHDSYAFVCISCEIARLREFATYICIVCLDNLQPMAQKNHLCM